MGRFLGTCAALSAPLLMTIGFVVWEKVWKGSAVMLNVVKCSLATVCFVLVAAAVSSSFAGTLQDVFMLILSSFIGITIGDNLWLYALQVLGPRKVIVCDSLKPFLATILGKLFLDENITLFYILGIFLTVSGVLAISLETSKGRDADDDEDTVEGVEQKGVGRKEKDPLDVETKGVELIETGTQSSTEKKITRRSEETDESKHVEGNGGRSEANVASRNTYTLRFGYACAIANVIFDVFGSFLTRFFGDDMTTFDINAIRFGSAAVLLGTITLSVRSYALCTFESRKAPEWTQLPSTLSRREWSLVVLGILLVTFGCPSLSNYALFEIPLGMCLTLTSVGPIYALPLTYISKGEPVTLTALFGAFAAFSGVAVLYLL